MSKGFIGVFSSVFVATFMFVAVADHTAEYQDRKTAVVRVMNKSAGKAKTLAIPVGSGGVEFEKLELIAHSCKETMPYDRKEFYMFIEIKKPGAGQLFSGWMTAGAPGDNPLQDPDYDVWLIGCE